jgi:hypothetical protein
MPTLTLKFPAGRSPMELEALAANMEREYGCEVVRATRLESIEDVVALDTVLALSRYAMRSVSASLHPEADASIQRVTVLRDKIRKTIAP